MVVVEINSTASASMILWKEPASWSAWQCVTIIFSINQEGTPYYHSTLDEYGGGSIITPLWLIQRIKPVVEPLQSKPCEFPKTVIPKAGGL